MPSTSRTPCSSSLCAASLWPPCRGCCSYFFFSFFFSSRRRHTRSLCDWSSDVCSSDLILSDPLDQNIHNWRVATTGGQLYQFKDGAYHITNNDPAQGAPAILADELLSTSFGYALTMEEIKGDDTSINNAFGMILHATSHVKSGKTITTFYSFEAVNMQGGEYEFWKYDNSQGSNVNPWKELWNHNFGSEFHQGHGPHSINTFKIFANGKNFTLIVNGKRVKTLQDGSFASGAIGMLVNLKGTEVAFSTLELTKD